MKKALPKKGQESRHRNAFTVTELLAGISIILVAAALLYPVLGSARETSRSAKCVSNLRGLGAAMGAYVAEKGHYPTMLTNFTGKWSDYWPDQLTSYLPDQSRTGAALNYPLKNEAFFCPSQKTHGIWGDYVANPSVVVFISTSNLLPRRPTSITNASQRMLLSDGSNGRGTGSFYLNVQFVDDPRNQRGHNLTGTLYPPIHQNLRNHVLFVDGHIRGMTFDEMLDNIKVLLGGAADLP